MVLLLLQLMHVCAGVYVDSPADRSHYRPDIIARVRDKEKKRVG